MQEGGGGLAGCWSRGDGPCEGWTDLERIAPAVASPSGPATACGAGAAYASCGTASAREAGCGATGLIGRARPPSPNPLTLPNPRLT